MDVSAWDFKWVKQFFTWEVYGMIHKTVTKLRKLWSIALHVLESSSCSADKYLIIANPVHKGLYCQVFHMSFSLATCCVYITVLLLGSCWVGEQACFPFQILLSLTFSALQSISVWQYKRSSRDPLWREESDEPVTHTKAMKQGKKDWEREKERWSFNSISDWFIRLVGWWCSLPSFFYTADERSLQNAVTERT